MKYLTEIFMDEFRDNKSMDLGTFGRKVQQKFKLNPVRMKLGRARSAALKIIHGDEKAQYSQLWDHGQELRRSNPGSKFIVCTTKVKEIGDLLPKDHLSSLYWSYDACKRCFLNGCMPILFVDGCHLKSKYKGNQESAYVSTWNPPGPLPEESAFVVQARDSIPPEEPQPQPQQV